MRASGVLTSCDIAFAMSLCELMRPSMRRAMRLNASASEATGERGEMLASKLQLRSPNLQRRVFRARAGRA